MENQDLLISLGLVEDTLDSTVRLTEEMLENVENLTDIEKVIAETTKKEMGNEALDAAKNNIIEVSNLANAHIGYASQFLQSLVVEYAATAGSILSAESTINQNIMSYNTTKTDAILNNTEANINTESMGFFARMWEKWKKMIIDIKNASLEILEGDKTVLEKMAQMLGTVLSGIFTAIAETFAPLIMTIASGFLHITESFKAGFDFSLDDILNSIVIGAPKLQAKFTAQKENWEVTKE